METRRTTKKSVTELLENGQNRYYPMTEEALHESVPEKALRWMMTGLFSFSAIFFLACFIYAGIEEGAGNRSVFLYFPVLYSPYFIALLYRQVKKASRLRITPHGIETNFCILKRRIGYEKVMRVLLKDTCRNTSRYRKNGGGVYKTTAYYCNRRGHRLFSFSFAANSGYQRIDGFDIRLDDILFAHPVRMICERWSPIGRMAYEGHGEYWMHRPLLKPMRYPMHYNIICNGIVVVKLFDHALLLRNLPSGEPALPEALLSRDVPPEWERAIRVDTHFFAERQLFRLSDWRRVIPEVNDDVLQNGVRAIADAWVELEKEVKKIENERKRALKKKKR